MAKLNRVTQKIFAGDAQPTETAVFGTMKTQSPVYTGDIAQLMSNPAFTQGWSSAVEESFAPFMEEMTGVQKVFSQQLAYLLQDGAPEWDAGTTYYKGNSAKVYDADSNNYQLYFSLTDDNIGNQPWTSAENWKLLYSSVSGIQSLSNLTTLINGSSTNTQYPSAKSVWDLFSTINPDLYEKLANKVQDLNSPNATTYPSSQAVANESSRIINIMNTQIPYLYEKLANKVQDLNSPNATTYPSSQAVANESSRIINIMNTQIPSRIIDNGGPGVSLIASNNVTFVLQWGRSHFGEGWGSTGTIILPKAVNNGNYYIGMIPISSSHTACLYISSRSNASFTWRKDASSRDSAAGDFLWFCLAYKTQ